MGPFPDDENCKIDIKVLVDSQIASALVISRLRIHGMASYKEVGQSKVIHIHDHVSEVGYHFQGDGNSRCSSTQVENPGRDSQCHTSKSTQMTDEFAASPGPKLKTQ